MFNPVQFNTNSDINHFLADIANSQVKNFNHNNIEQVSTIIHKIKSKVESDKIFSADGVSFNEKLFLETYQKLDMLKNVKIHQLSSAVSKQKLDLNEEIGLITGALQDLMVIRDKFAGSLAHGGHKLAGFESEWDKNALAKNSKANNLMLLKLITDSKVSNEDLYQFFMNKKIKPTGGWFATQGKPTPLALKLASSRGIEVTEFFAKYSAPKILSEKFDVSPLAGFESEWDKNALAKNSKANNLMLLKLITDSKLSNEDLYQFFMNKKIKPTGGWFATQGKPTPIALEFASKRGMEVTEFFAKYSAPKILPAKLEAVAAPMLHPLKPKTVTRENFSTYMQDITDRYYGKPFPHRDEIKVEHNGQQVLWTSLTPKEKFDVVYEHSLPHNRPKLMTRDKFASDEQWVNHIEDRLFRGSHKSDGSAYIPAGMEHDPRLSHGSDHGMRVGIFSAVYAALYNKYDPSINLTPEDLLSIQFAGAFHDSGRQTEGVDVDDKRSADNARENLKAWGFSEKHVKEGAEAISGKDAQHLSTKSLIAKCVQCADSTEYGRVGPFHPKYLDIYKEFNGYQANSKESWNENIVPKSLKEGRTIEEFNQEIDAVNAEMASIMKATSTTSMRKIFSQPGKNYYEEILKVINPQDHPRTHAMFTDLGVIGSKAPAITPVTSEQIHKAQKGTVQPTVVAPTLEKTGELFPGMLSEVQFAAKLGGSTGAVKVVDQKGVEYAKKTTGDKIIPEHLKSEYHTNKAYLVLGVKVPEVALYHATSSKRIKEGEEGTVDQPVMLSKFVPEGTVDLDKYLEGLGLNTKNCSMQGVLIPNDWKVKNAGVIKELQDVAKKSFVADCLLANWDVAGLEFDNMRYDPVKKEIWRIDNGAGLNFRAQGGIKDPKFFTPHIQEFETLRNPNINLNTSLLFATITNDEIIQQIDDILPNREAFLATIPAHLKEIMGKRFDYLVTYRDKLSK